MEHELVIICPDGAWKAVMNALFSRPESLGIRRITPHVIVDPMHDSSLQVVELLRSFLRDGVKVLVVRDLHGSGREHLGEAGLEQEIVAQLQTNGWPPKDVSAIVADPEVESWLRFDSVHLGRLIQDRARKNRSHASDWKTRLEDALKKFGGTTEIGKPKQPKEVFNEITQVSYGIPTSTSLLGHLASVESLKRCQTPSFNRFLGRMRDWFPST
jgi:hypothetical protein